MPDAECDCDGDGDIDPEYSNDCPYNTGAVCYGLSDIVQIDAGERHSVALKSDGTIVSWGISTCCNVNFDNPYWGSHTNDLTDVIQVSAGSHGTLVLKADGTVDAWGQNSAYNVPDGISDVVEISAGGQFNLALKSDGTVYGWGLAADGRLDSPDWSNNCNDVWTGNCFETGLSDVVAIEAGFSGHSLALKSDGTVLGFGRNPFGGIDIPSDLTAYMGDCLQDCSGEWGGDSELTGCDNTCNSTLANDCAGVCGGDSILSGCDKTCHSTLVDDCAGVCGGDSELSGCDSACNSTAVNDDCGVCDGYATTGSGDINVDGSLDVLDIVAMVEHILEETFISECEMYISDMNSDGGLNVNDIVQSVYIILNGNLARTSDQIANTPSSVEIIKGNETVSYHTDKNGLIGFEFTLSHGDDFSISLSEGSFVSEYNT